MLGTGASLAACSDECNNPYSGEAPTVVAAISDDRRATNHSNTTIDLTTVFASRNGTLSYDVTAPAGVSTANSDLTFDYATLGAGTHTITVTATDSYANSITDEFVLEVVILHDNTLRRSSDLLGTTYADEITGNLALTRNQISSITFDGGAGNDTISNNPLTVTSGTVYSVTFDGGAGLDTISDNTFTGEYINTITFAGGDGNDTISNNTLTASLEIHTINFVGDDGNDTISNNTFIAGRFVRTITLAGEAGNDTISDNHFETTWTDGDTFDVYEVTLMGDAGDDTFRNNTATQANGESASLTIDGGDGEDTVVFRLMADDYTGVSATGFARVVTITGDGAEVVLRKVESLSFADGTTYRAIDIYGAKQHNTQSVDLANLLFESDSTVYSATLANGIALSSGTLTFNNTVLASAIHSFTVTATDGGEVITHTLFYALDTILESSNSSDTFYTGSTLADAITGNSFSASTTLSIVDVFGGDGNDTISGNTLTAYDGIYSSTFDGGAGDDTISNNTHETQRVQTITFDGGDGNDTLSDNTLIASEGAYSITFAGGNGDDTISGNTLLSKLAGLRTISLDGGDGDDTISSNTLTGRLRVETLTFDGGDGNDTISDNHFESTGTNSISDVLLVRLNGAAGDDVFSGNTTTQVNGELAGITIDGGQDRDGLDTDKVYFDLASDMFDITSAYGAYGSDITVTDKAARTKASDGVDSYGAYRLIDIEELYFDDILFVFSYGSNTMIGGTDIADTINDNLFVSDVLTNVHIDGDVGDDTISNNTLTGDGGIATITFAGGDGNDTLSSNTLTADNYVTSITFAGDDGNDTISDNHFESTGTNFISDVYSVTFIGGAGDDVFSGNTATQANGERSSITIDGGADTDKVYFELASNMFSITGGSGSNITVTDSAKRTGAVDSYAEYVLIDIEELYFDDTLYVFP